MGSVVSYITNSIDTLVSSYVAKTIFSVIGAIAIWLIGIKHVQIMGVFILLVAIDLITKWAAIAYQMLIDEFGYSADRIATWEKYRAIPIAFQRRLISSRYMRTGFVSKVITYVVVTAAAFLFDSMAGNMAFAVNLTWLYLGSSEFVSILENLRDGGNTTMGKFLDLIKNKIDNKVKL